MVNVKYGGRIQSNFLLVSNPLFTQLYAKYSIVIILSQLYAFKKLFQLNNNHLFKHGYMVSSIPI